MSDNDTATLTPANPASTDADMLDKQLTREVEAALGGCVRCGLCAESCHYYSAQPQLQNMPVYRGEAVRKFFRQAGSRAKGLFHRPAKAKTDVSSLDTLADMAFGKCTLCRRCTVNCPVGVDTAALMRTARAIATASGKAPEILVQLADAAISRGENMELFRDMLLDRFKELEVETRNKINDPAFSIPVGKKGADMLFVGLSGEHSIVPPAILFHYAGANWTLSLFEASNYGSFLGDSERSKKIAQRIIDEAGDLGVKEVVIGECGHAYTVLRWEAPKWFKKALPFRVRSLIEVLAEWIQSGRLILNPEANPDPVTYHDSCNLGRNGGLLEEPRVVLRAAVKDFREMYPNREESYCCGGGSGMVAVSEWEERRMLAGLPKARQIKATGAKIVVASCDNCRIQLGELNERYNLGIKVTGLADLVVNAVVKK
ncbi:MAG: (Fe-S)-binding protein [Dehalococcoidia bacterium]|jgi:Fe-S oxidoreductase